MSEPILVTHAQYWSILWMAFNAGFLHFMTVAFAAPHERQDNAGSN